MFLGLPFLASGELHSIRGTVLIGHPIVIATAIGEGFHCNWEYTFTNDLLAPLPEPWPCLALLNFSFFPPWLPQFFIFHADKNLIIQRTFICYWVWLLSWDAVLLPTGLQLLCADPEEILPKRFHLNQSNPVKASVIPGKHRFHICGFLIQNTM